MLEGGTVEAEKVGAVAMVLKLNGCEELVVD